MPQLHFLKDGKQYDIELYTDKKTSPALCVLYNGTTYYAALSSDLNHSNATPLRVSVGGVTYVLLTKLVSVPAYTSLGYNSGNQIKFTVPVGVTKVKATVSVQRGVLFAPSNPFLYQVTPRKTYTTVAAGNSATTPFFSFVIKIEYGQGIEESSGTLVTSTPYIQEV